MSNYIDIPTESYFFHFTQTQLRQLQDLAAAAEYEKWKKEQQQHKIKDKYSNK